MFPLGVLSESASDFYDRNLNILEDGSNFKCDNKKKQTTKTDNAQRINHKTFSRRNMNYVNFECDN